MYFRLQIRLRSHNVTEAYKSSLPICDSGSIPVCWSLAALLNLVIMWAHHLTNLLLLIMQMKLMKFSVDELKTWHVTCQQCRGQQKAVEQATDRLQLHHSLQEHTLLRPEPKPEPRPELMLSHSLHPHIPPALQPTSCFSWVFSTSTGLTPPPVRRPQGVERV